MSRLLGNFHDNSFVSADILVIFPLSRETPFFDRLFRVFMQQKLRYNLNISALPLLMCNTVLKERPRLLFFLLQSVYYYARFEHSMKYKKRNI